MRDEYSITYLFYSLNRLRNVQKSMVEKAISKSEDNIRNLYKNQSTYLENFMLVLLHGHRRDGDRLLIDMGKDPYNFFTRSFRLLSYNNMMDKIDSECIIPATDIVNKDLCNIQESISHYLSGINLSPVIPRSVSLS